MKAISLPAVRAPERVARRAIWFDRTLRLGAGSMLIVGSIAFLAPLWVMLCMALKTPTEIAQTSPWAWPQNPQWVNFQTVLTNPNVSFGLFFRNTFFIATMATVGAILSASLVAFPFARLEFRGRDRLFLLLLSTMMLPGIVTMIPSYVLFKHLGWVNTFYPLWVPAWLGGGAFNVFLLRQFFMGIPKELDEAALLDGASYYRIYWSVILPLSGPALATVALFSVIHHWRDFMGPLLYLNDTDKQTLEMGLRTYQTLTGSDWHLLMAGSVLVMLPLIVIFVLGQRYFVRGIALTGGK